MKHRRVSLIVALFFPLLAFALFFSFVKPVLAATRTVGSIDCPTTIQACINISLPGDTVFIPAGTYNESLSLNTAVTLTGESLNTTIIQAPPGQRVLWIDGAAVDATVSVSDLTLQNGDVSASNICFPFPTNCGGGILLTNGAQPQLRNLIIENNQAYQGGGLYADAGSVLSLDNVTFRDNVSVLSGGGAYFNEAVTIANSLFETNMSTNNVGGGMRASGNTIIENSVFRGNETCPGATGICHGAGLYAFELNLTIYDSLFEDNICHDGDCDGGGVYLNSSFVTVTLTLSNTEFIDNSAGRHGGGAVANSFRVNTRLHNGRFERNDALSGAGGGMYAYRAIITGTQFLTNTAVAANTFDYGGGGLRLQTSSVVTNALFSGNHSDKGGGGLMVFLGPFTLHNSTFFNNTADEIGGGAQIELSGGTVTDSLFENNRVLDAEIINDDNIGNGGGLWFNGALTLSNVDFISNTATNRGGGLYSELFSAGDLLVNNGRFQGNQALGSELVGDGGGGIYNFTQPMFLNNVQFINNEALATGGGGIYSFGPITESNSLFQGNSALFGGGLYVDGRFTSVSTQYIGNSAVNSGGGASTAEAAEFVNVLFQGNSSTGTGLGQGSGGGLRATEIVTLTNSQFLSNTAVGGAGGGVSIFAGISMTNTLFQGNQSGSSGGGVSAAFDLVSVHNSQFLNNSATFNGGGLASSGNIDLVDSLFQENQSNGSGGGLFTSGSLFLADSDVLSNTAVVDGGGAFINSNNNYTNGRFQGNQSGDRGGGIYTGSFFTVDGTEFSNNQADNGGAVFSNFDITLANAHFENNTAVTSGGAVQVRRNSNISRTMFINNQAQLGGGIAISGTLNGSTVSQIVNTVLSQNGAASAGSAIYHDSCGSSSCRPLELIHTTISGPPTAGSQAIVVITGTFRITNSIITTYTTGINNVGGNVSSGFNVYFGLSTPEIGVVSSSNIQTGDPVFVDPTIHDYRLVTSSSALDTGIDLGIPFDFLGVTRGLGTGVDIGAYEGEFSPTAVTLSQFKAVQSVPSQSLFIVIIVLSVLTLASFNKIRNMKS